MEQTKTRSPADAKYYINSLIGLFFILGFGHIPAIEPLTQVGMQIAGIFIGLIYLWSTVDLIWPSILGILAFGLSDYCTMTEAIASGLGSQVVWMLIMLMMISEAIRVSGVGEIIARWIITRRVLNGRPLLFTFMFSSARSCCSRSPPSSSPGPSSTASPNWWAIKKETATAP